MIITKLLNIGICKVSVGSHHASVLTLDGRVFLWGRNDFNQVTLENKLDQCSPKLFVIANEKIKDVICGCFHTVILSHESNVYYFGIDSECICSLCSTDELSDTLTNNNETNTQEVILFTNLLCTNSYSLLNQANKQNDCIIKHIEKQQKLLEEMLMVHLNIIKPLIKKTSLCLEAELYHLLCESFVNLMYATAVNIESLLKFENNLVPDVEIIMLQCAEELILIHNKYLGCICDLISIDGFKYLSKILDVPQCLYKLRPNISKKDLNSEEQIINSLLLKPIQILPYYIEAIETLTKVSASSLDDVHHKWISVLEEQESLISAATLTQQFWTNSGKAIDFLKSPKRRLLRSSYTHPIHLSNASRFSSHNLILFSDIFVHLSGSTPTVHNLTTIWVDHLQNDAGNQHQLCLKMPEDNLVLYTTEPEDKIEWFHSLQNAIKVALNKKDALQPPLVRSTGYTFTRNGMYKDAKYLGRWSNAKMHGSGKLEWKDGRVYTGQFINHQLSGFGRMEIPNVGNVNKVYYFLYLFT